MNQTFIDKLAFIFLENKKILVTLSKGKDVWYIPGGKREGAETDEQALTREVEEELTVKIIPQSIKKYGIFTAQAHGKPLGTLVRMTCYQADFKGHLRPSHEIDQIDFFTYSQKHQTSPVDHLIFEDLYRNNLIA